MQPRPIVFVLTPHYLPGYKAGGPIRTIGNLVASIGDEFDFRIFTSDRDYGQPEPFTGVRRNDWNTVENAHVYYGDASARRPHRLAQTIASVRPDIVYLNSFFSPQFSISPLLLRRLGWTAPHVPWIVAPRGEFSRGALALKTTKKRAFMAASRIIGLHNGLIWQASSHHEVTDIEREFKVPSDSIHIAPNLTAPVECKLPPTARRTDPSRLSVCFLARVCAMKNLAFAIETLAQCDFGIDFHVYGPIEDEAYATSCRATASTARGHLRVEWYGEVPHEHVREVLARHDVFFLPTLGENFGHGIFEALAAGVPVLLSDRTPWRDLDAEGVGWVRPLDQHRPFVDALKSLAEMPPAMRIAMRERAHAYAAKVAASSESRDANRRLLHGAMKRLVPTNA